MSASPPARSQTADQFDQLSSDESPRVRRVKSMTVLPHASAEKRTLDAALHLQPQAGHMAQVAPRLFDRRRRRRAWLAGGAVLLIVLTVSAIWRPALKRQTKWAVVATNVYQDVLRRTHLRTDQIGQVT